MDKRLIIIGAGGQGRVIADIAVKNGYSEIAYIDDHATGVCMGFPVIGMTGDIEKLNDGKTDFIIGIGNNAVRKTFAEKYAVNWATLIHPSAQIAAGVTLGEGTVVMAGAIVNPCACVGVHCIINTGAIVEHDNIIEDYAHISPRAALGGTVRIGIATHVGIGATIKNNISICDHCVVGAGAVVVKDITIPGTYIGIPAKERS